MLLYTVHNFPCSPNTLNSREKAIISPSSGISQTNNVIRVEINWWGVLCVICEKINNHNVL